MQISIILCLNHFCISLKKSFAGELYTWGKGRYGRLGHGDSEDQTKPKLVEALLGCRVIDVACGKQDYGHIHLQYFPLNINIKLFFLSTSWRNKLTGKWSFGFIYFSVNLSQLFSDNFFRQFIPSRGWRKKSLMLLLTEKYYKWTWPKAHMAINFDIFCPIRKWRRSDSLHYWRWQRLVLGGRRLWQVGPRGLRWLQNPN